MTNLNKALSETFGIEYIPDTSLPVVIKEAKKEVLEEVIALSDDTTSDYELARKTLRDLIKKGNAAIDDIHEVAKADETARSYEVLGGLIKTVAETTSDLYDIHKKTKELKDMDYRRRGSSDVNIDKAVFVGTTSELLDKLKNESNG